MRQIGIATLLLLSAMNVSAQRLPKMGWASYNAFFLWIDEEKIKGQADQMVALGLNQLGYKYINIDDGYQNGRDAEGRLQVIEHSKNDGTPRFPNGLRTLTDYIHGKGLKAGIYTDAGRNNCGYEATSQNGGSGDDVGMYGHWEEDARLFFDEWNFDFLKVDFCGAESMGLVPRTAYERVGQAVATVEKPREDIELNICSWGFPGTWAYDVADSWRSVGDIFPDWLDTKRIIKENVYLGGFNRDGHYNDMDMLEVGRPDNEQRRLTATEEATQFGMWCLMSSPLMLGCDLRTIPSHSLQLISNPELIAINQDSLGIGAELVGRQGDVYVLAKDLEEHHGPKRAVGITNLTDEVQSISIPASRLGYRGMMQLRDAIGRRECGKALAVNVTLHPHETAIYIIKGTRAEQRRYEAENAYMNGYWENLRPTRTDSEGIEIDERYQMVFQQKASASCGTVVGWLGYIPSNGNLNDADCYLEWNRVWSDKGGRYSIAVNFYSGAQRSFVLYVNGELIKTFMNVTSGSFDVRASVSTEIELQPGLNTIRLGYYGQPTAQRDMPDMDYIDLTPLSSAHELSESDMLANADELMTAAMQYLFDQNGNRGSTSDKQRFQWSEKYERGASKGTGNATIWPQGFGLATLAQMARAMLGTDRYTTYKQATDRLAARFPEYVTTINGIQGYSVYGGTQHRFLDDNAWAALGLLEAYDLDRNNDYLAGAEMVASYLVEAGRLLEEDPPTGGGMYWQDSPADDENTYKTKNTANNAPAITLFCRLYEITGEGRYLDYARRTYQWLRDTLLDTQSWLMWDNINVVTGSINKYQAPYTTGAMLHAASLLYTLTGEATYKTDADQLADAAFSRWFETYTSEVVGQSIKLVRTESNTHSDDIVVLMRAYEAYSQVSSNRRYLTAIGQSLRHIWGTRRDSQTGLMNYDWKGTDSQDEWTSLGQTGYVEMFVRMASLEADGWNMDDEVYVPTVIEAESATRRGGITVDPDAGCSGGKRVGYVGNGNTLTFTFDAQQAGIYEFTVFYMTYGARPLTITVNSTARHNLNCPSTDSWDSSNIGTISVSVELRQGRNTFVVGNQTDWAPNLDKFELLLIEPIDDETSITSPLIRPADNLIFTLDGKVMGREPGRRGIYIRNGKKFIHN